MVRGFVRWAWIGGVGILGGVAAFACSTFEAGDEPVLAPSDSAIPFDAGLPDAPPPEDARADDAKADAGPAARFSIQCGDSVCTVNDAGPQACCYDTNEAPPEAFSCANPADMCVDTARRYVCDDANDCTALGLAGRVCCGKLVTFGTIYFQDSASCIAPDNCTGPDELVLCDQSIAKQCGSGTTCKEVKTLPRDAGATVYPAVYACRP
jgi:hypothetical protein